MEFKRPIRYREREQTHTVPRRSNTVSTAPSRQVPQVIQASKTAMPTHKFKFTKKTGIITGTTILVLVGFIITGALVNRHAVKNARPNTDTGEIIENLEYQSVLPEGKSISDLDGWKRVSPPDSEPVFTYTDSIDGISISVSQQPLPASFKGNTDSNVAELAQKFNATNKIDADQTTVYVGTSAKGPQSAIFTKNNLLIMIKSQEKVDDESWAKYVSSLN